MSRFCEGEGERLVNSSIDDPTQSLVRFQKKMPLGVHARSGGGRKSLTDRAADSVRRILDTTLSANVVGEKSPEELAVDAQKRIVKIVNNYANRKGITRTEAFVEIGQNLQDDLDDPTS